MKRIKILVIGKKSLLASCIKNNSKIKNIKFIQYKNLKNLNLNTFSHIINFSIDPKNTRTVFEGYDIKNEVGNIYIGPGYRKHKVEVDEHFDQPRITLGYDIETNPKKYPHAHYWGLIPLL